MESLVRVRVVGQGRRLDVCLPTRVPVRELLPDVLRGLGWHGASGTPCLVSGGGEALDLSLPLDVQGVRDGALLAVAAEQEHRPPVLDDLVEAVHDRSRALVPGWSAEVVRRTGAVLVLVGLALVLGLLLLGGTAPEVGLGASAAVLAVAAAQAAPARGGSEDGVLAAASVVAGWLAVLAAWSTGAFGVVVLGVPSSAQGMAGAAAVVAGTGLVATAGERWPLHCPPVLVVLAWVAAEAVAVWGGATGWQVVLVGLVVAVLVAGAVPGLVVEATVVCGQGSRVRAGGVRVARLDADVVLAHRMVLALSLTGTLLLLTVAPAAVADGPAAAGVVLLVVALRLVRVRHRRSAALVLAGAGGAVAVVVVALVGVALLQPAWTSYAVTGTLGLVAAAALGGRVRGGATWWGWCLDGLEVLLVVALPLALTAALWWPTWWPTW